MSRNVSLLYSFLVCELFLKNTCFFIKCLFYEEKCVLL